MNVVFLVKARERDPLLDALVQIGLARGHGVRRLDKQAFLQSDLGVIDVVCMKSHLDDENVWRKLAATPTRVVNRRLRVRDRVALDAMLRGVGVRVPASATCPQGLRHPVVRKVNDLFAASDVRTLDQPHAVLDSERYCYQEHVDGDGVLRKVYCMGGTCAVVDETDGQRGRARNPSPVLASQSLAIGRLLGLEVFGLDFIGRRDDALTLIDVNPFPSFRGWTEASSVFWPYLEA